MCFDKNKIPSDNDNNIEVLRSKIRNYEELLTERDAQIIKLEALVQKLSLDMERLALRLKDSEKKVTHLQSQVENQDDSNSPPLCKK
ncbi:unnamed protein product [Rotaria socialis]|uniref:Roquin II domain-containing protein n=1 Tax=Rotaria socialis TaxID=392032 RepID=A0A817TEQ3_9BILA|nr:unnamed protein product [Rotaria socialis]CAF3331578.1 unnamed protein product [Rotaria socialis]CAF3575368.1 unnamed protein product [Rotaria socialis]